MNKSDYQAIQKIIMFSFFDTPSRRKRRKLDDGSHDAAHFHPLGLLNSTLHGNVSAAKQTATVEEFVSSVRMSCKFDVLLNIILHCVTHGDKLVIFSSFRRTLNKIEDLLGKLSTINSHVDTSNRIVNINEGAEFLSFQGTHWSSCLPQLGSWKKKQDFLRIDGKTKKDDRLKIVKEFNEPSSPSKLLLVTTKAGGIGTNLIGANRAVLMDVSWNPTTDEQAIFRLFRIGQKKEVSSIPNHFFLLNASKQVDPFCTD